MTLREGRVIASVIGTCISATILRFVFNIQEPIVYHIILGIMIIRAIILYKTYKEGGEKK